VKPGKVKHTHEVTVNRTPDGGVKVILLQKDSNEANYTNKESFEQVAIRALMMYNKVTSYERHREQVYLKGYRPLTCKPYLTRT